MPKQELPNSPNLKFWLPSSKRTTAIVLSPVEWWFSHWVRDLKRSRKCAGNNCLHCAQGDPVVLRYVLAIRRADGIPCLIELRDRHRELLNEMCAHPDGAPGHILAIKRKTEAAKSWIEVELLSDQKEAMVPMDISRLVATLGLPPLLVPKAARRG